MTKMIFGTVVAVGIVSGAIGGIAGAWSYNAVRTTQAMHGKNLPVENWEPAY